MNLIKNIQDMLALQNQNEKRTMLSNISDIFEYYRVLPVEERIEAIKMLLLPALQEEDQTTKLDFFNAINTAVVTHQTEDIRNSINWDILIPELSVLDKWQLEFAINILSVVGQERHLHALDKYTYNTDPEIREWALDAIESIKERIARLTDAQKNV